MPPAERSWTNHPNLADSHTDEEDKMVSWLNWLPLPCPKINERKDSISYCQRFSFVLYRLPSKETVLLVPKDKTVHTTDFSRPVCLCPLVAKPEKLCLPNTHRFLLFLKKGIDCNGCYCFAFNQKENFIKQVEAAVEALRQSMEKVVLSNVFSLPYKGML